MEKGKNRNKTEGKERGKDVFSRRHLFEFAAERIWRAGGRIKRQAWLELVLKDVWIILED